LKYRGLPSNPASRSLEKIQYPVQADEVAKGAASYHQKDFGLYFQCAQNGTAFCLPQKKLQLLPD
jgi:hypothetical protein